MLELFSQIMSLNPSRMSKQKGSTLMMALFIMIILILLGSALMKVLSSSSEAIAQEVIGTRAYMAANSAMQAELSKLFPLNAAVSQCNASATYNFSSSGANIDGLFNCTAIINCTNYATHPVTNEEFYRLTSTGKCASSVLQSDSKNIVVSSRKIQVEAKELL